ncbi:hypothetical protein FACS189472_07620 [Alphaproteobacteria bacterium]|nr:hypothetical protein FACS189472_07620 [Alphaproteobacteria bacterium]
MTSQNSKTSSGDESKDLRRQLQEANTRLQKKEAELSAATGANTAEEIPADKKKGFDDAAAEVKRLEDLGSIRPLTAEETSKLKEADAVWEKILTQPDVKNTKTALKAQLESAKRRSNFPKADSPAVDKVTKKKLETTNTALRHTLTETYDAPVQTPATGIALNYNGLRALTPTDTELQQAKTALTANTSGATGLGAIFRKYTSQSDHDAELTAAICKVCSLDHVQSELATVQTAPNLVQLATWTTRRNTAGNLWTQTDFEKDIEKYLVLLCSDL